MRIAVIASAVCLVAGCATTDFDPVAPQPMGFEKDNPCNEMEPIQRAQAEYPQGWRQPGWVALQYDVAAEGAPSNIVVSSSSPQGSFDPIAIGALQQWRYHASEAPTVGCRILFTFRPPD